MNEEAVLGVAEPGEPCGFGGIGGRVRLQGHRRRLRRLSDECRGQQGYHPQKESKHT